MNFQSVGKHNFFFFLKMFVSWQTDKNLCTLTTALAVLHRCFCVFFFNVAMASEAVTNKVVTLKATVYLNDVL